ncbi:helix-turn-helix transcriptional regulator [Tsukamurella soli]|uniref:helix-turn-helix transcriptional regulator n=1 Tax=Tsukamurella soli TaxID=644556 RepID=UPI0031E97E5B
MAEVAKATGLSTKTLYRMCRNGQLQSHKFGARTVIFDGDLQRYLDGHRGGGAA